MLYTIENTQKAELKIKRSVFIGWAKPVKNITDISSFKTEASSMYKDATHVCWAYRLGYKQPLEENFSDGGEPAGTAGRPIVNAIKSKNLSNVMVVVIRYYGGVKLGIPGLIEAYNTTALKTLEKCNIKELYIKSSVSITANYDNIGFIMNQIKKLQPNLKDISQRWEEYIYIEFKIKQSQKDNYEKILKEWKNKNLITDFSIKDEI